MATISTNDHAPADTFRVSFAGLPPEGVEFGGDTSFETNNREALSNAEAHPWLEVEYPAQDERSLAVRDPHVPYEDDYLSAANSVAFDPDQIIADLPEDLHLARTAIDAGLDQSESVETEGGVNLTLAAADEDAEEPTEEEQERAVAPATADDFFTPDTDESEEDR